MKSKGWAWEKKAEAVGSEVKSDAEESKPSEPEGFTRTELNRLAKNTVNDARATALGILRIAHEDIYGSSRTSGEVVKMLRAIERELQAEIAYMEKHGLPGFIL